MGAQYVFDAIKGEACTQVKPACTQSRCLLYTHHVASQLNCLHKALLVRTNWRGGCRLGKLFAFSGNFRLWALRIALEATIAVIVFVRLIRHIAHHVLASLHGCKLVVYLKNSKGDLGGFQVA